MLAGLIFATSEASDRPEALIATLPFGAASLVEFQARLLIAAGASQILVAVARVTPELLGAASRIGTRGVAVDIVRSAGEAAAKVHPLARVIVLADGLVTTEAQLAPFAGEGAELLLVTEDENGLERLDATHRWAGIARIGAQRLAETASLPRDYDFLSALMRVTVQHGGTKLLLPPGASREGYGIEHDARGLAQRGRAVFASLADNRVRWIDRWVFAPIAKVALPLLVARGVSPLVLVAVGGVTAAGGLFAIWRDWLALGLGAVTLAAALFAVVGTLAWLRGEERASGWTGHATAGLSAAAIGLTGVSEGAAGGSATAAVLALVVIAAAGLLERIAVIAAPRRWWPAPAAYPLLLIPFAALGQATAGLAAAGLYAGATLWSAIEDVRAKS